jgi:hypothetical protein
MFQKIKYDENYCFDKWMFNFKWLALEVTFSGVIFCLLSFKVLKTFITLKVYMHLQ